MTSIAVKQNSPSPWSSSSCRHGYVQCPKNDRLKKCRREGNANIGFDGRGGLGHSMSKSASGTAAVLFLIVCANHLEVAERKTIHLPLRDVGNACSAFSNAVIDCPIQLGFVVVTKELRLRWRSSNQVSRGVNLGIRENAWVHAGSRGFSMLWRANSCSYED